MRQSPYGFLLFNYAAKVINVFHISKHFHKFLYYSRSI